MANYCFVAPILPGQEEEVKGWGKKGIFNNADHDRVMDEAGVTQENEFALLITGGFDVSHD